MKLSRLRNDVNEKQRICNLIYTVFISLCIQYAFRIVDINYVFSMCRMIFLQLLSLIRDAIRGVQTAINYVLSFSFNVHAVIFSMVQDWLLFVNNNV